MGLYSDNRVIKLAENMNNPQSEIIQDESYIDFANIDVDEYAPSLMETSIMIAEADQKMFDTLIGLDFVEVRESAEGNAINENAATEKIKAILSKVQGAVNSIIEAIKKAIHNAVVKIKEFTINIANKPIVTLVEKIPKEKWDKMRVTVDLQSNITVDPETLKSWLDDDFGSVDDEKDKKIDSTSNRIIGLISSNNTTGTDLDDAIGSMEQTIASLRAGASNNTEKSVTTLTITSANKAQYVDKSLDLLKNGDKIISTINKRGNIVIKRINDALKAANKDETDEKVVAMRAKFVTKFSRLMTTYTNAYIDEHITRIKYARKILIAAMHGAKKPEKEEKTEAQNASAVPFLSDLSDVYVEEFFAY